MRSKSPIIKLMKRPKTFNLPNLRMKTEPSPRIKLQKMGQKRTKIMIKGGKYPLTTKKKRTKRQGSQHVTTKGSEYLFSAQEISKRSSQRYNFGGYQQKRRIFDQMNRTGSLKNYIPKTIKNKSFYFSHNKTANNFWKNDKALNSSQYNYFTPRLTKSTQNVFSPDIQKSKSKLNSFISKAMTSTQRNFSNPKIFEDHQARLSCFKNLKEELKGNIYNEKKFDNLTDEVSQIENLEKWKYESTEVNRVNLMKQLDNSKGEKLVENINKDTFEQNLKIPELNLDVLNIANTRERKKMEVKHEERLKQAKIKKLEGKTKQPKKRKTSFSKLGIAPDEPAHLNVKTQSNLTDLNSDIINSTLIKKIQKSKKKFKITQGNKLHLAKKIEEMVKEMLFQFKTLKNMAISKKYKFSFEKFMKEYTKANRVKRKVNRIEDYYEINRERKMQEEAEREEMYYMSFFKLLEEIESKDYMIDKLRKDNIRRVDWIKKQMKKVSGNAHGLR